MTVAAEAGHLGQLRAAARDSSRDGSWRSSPYAFSNAAATFAAGALPAQSHSSSCTGFSGRIHEGLMGCSVILDPEQFLSSTQRFTSISCTNASVPGYLQRKQAKNTFIQQGTIPDDSPQLIQGSMHSSMLHIHQHPQDPGRQKGLATSSGDLLAFRSPGNAILW